MPDWEVLVLLGAGGGGGEENATCAFYGGATSPARARGKLTPSGRHAYVCVLPEKARRRKKLIAPRLVFSDSGHGSAARSPPPEEKEKEMLRWSGRLVYSSAVVDDDDSGGGQDVLVFAKGVNPRQGVNRDASDISCVYYHRRAGAGDKDIDVVASLPAATSAQQVFRCPPPPAAASSSSSTQRELRVTLAITGEEKPIPSLAVYTPPPLLPLGDSSPAAEKKDKKLICACTMVRDVAKFLGEWVAYHTAVGVDRFFIYDNGSEDDLADRVRQLNEAGYDMSTVAWPWAKAQEAGFSHAAAAHRDSCEWMAFVDVDEFIFSPRWVESKKPAKSMLRSVLSVEPDVGQVSLGCADFGPSGQTANPKEGVTQGYTCRKRTEERHKSLVRLDVVDRSLVNSVHHFALRPGFRGEWNRRVRVNHYKYQAWEEFKVKFRRRVSTYVADWTDPVNLQSKDRTPGLGFEAVEPVGWTHKFCEVNDTLLQDASRRWFGVGFGSKLARPQTHSSS
ncbi:hypothetical protein BRADI_1g29760v3 [Brachypodium distachyon]|uniref:Glycosyltransferase family 92 protein n=2 Tax=Brachypodium distachyon TaxID=15368 RepID=A0A0Q3JX55_BRADI|nr:hypothetical protein BRADI_1g29760v3 [Brachypodium distachyon]